jgi:hypothetical protein
MTDPAEARRQLAEDARDLLSTKAFTEAVLALRRQWFAELMTAAEDNLRISLTLKLQALEAIPMQLNSFINDQKIHRGKP